MVFIINSYSDEEKAVTAVINANTYFGARHGLETLFQLVEYDDVERHFVVLSEVDIANDHPEFVHRGLSLDTSRNFIEPDVIRRTLDGMSHAKLNVLHWHIVDTHSFPVELKGDPIRQLTQYGAYDPDKIYSQETVKEIVDYANYRGKTKVAIGRTSHYWIARIGNLTPSLGDDLPSVMSRHLS